MTVVVLDIDSLDLQGQGKALNGAHPVLVEGGLPGERVRARIRRSRPHYSKASLVSVERESSQRVLPACPHYGVCGGCNMQHMDVHAQLAIKQRIVEEALDRTAGMAGVQILPALHGPAWGYRYRARLSVRMVAKKGGILVGFRERNSRYVADMASCAILPPKASRLLLPLRQLIARLSRPERIPQIEIAMGDSVLVFVLRHLEPLTAQDKELLAAFGRTYDVSWWLQAKGPDSVQPLHAADAELLSYALPEYEISLGFRPTDFTQVNHQTNQRLVSRAVRLLAPVQDERVVDFFCGLGNFSLPLATVANNVVGIEGSPALVARAQKAACTHGLEAKTHFFAKDLFTIDLAWLRSLGRFDRALIDPPREGAVALVKALSALPSHERPKRIVYVSCNPDSLARDAGILVHVGGYRLRQVGVVNMFAHTAHVESMAVFE